MLEIKDVKVYNLEESIVKSGFPMDTGELVEDFQYHVDCVKAYFESLKTHTFPINKEMVEIGKKHCDRARKLSNTPAGSGHSCWEKGVRVSFNLKYPEYISPQLQRYNWFDIESSQSKMHRLTKMNVKDSCNKYVDDVVIDNLNKWIDIYNNKDNFVTKDNDEVTSVDGKFYTKYEVFMKIISNCPLGLEKWMGISTNYMQLKTIFNQRKSHRLKEDYSVLCDFILSLPMFKSHVIKNY